MAALYRQLKRGIHKGSVEDVKIALQNGADANNGGEEIIRYLMKVYPYGDPIKKYEILRILLEAEATHSLIHQSISRTFST